MRNEEGREVSPRVVCRTEEGAYFSKHANRRGAKSAKRML
jgi:hypothetical protein